MIRSLNAATIDPNRFLLALAAGCLAASGLAAQTTVSLVKPDAEFPEPFTRVSAVRELPSGKVLVADMADKVVQMLDFASGSMTKVGREGQGPGEYALPAGLVPMPGGETWIYDMLGRRFLTVDPAGKPGKNVSLPGLSSGGRMVMTTTGGAGDGAGRYYYQAPPFNMENPEAAQPDSTPILRWDGKEKVDTAAWMSVPKMQISTSSSGGSRFSMRIGGGKVFSPAELWGVAGDGSVARVLPSPYRVVWYAPTGRATAGPVQPYTPLKVTAADKAEVIEQRKKMRPMMITAGPGGRQMSTGNIQMPDPEFEETKPPFTGQSSVVVAPEGEVWVRRTQPAGTKAPLYDVFDRSGALVRKVTLRPESTVIGFGKGTVYVVRTDEDDLQYLERFRR